jgi:hypothetical protein
MSRILIQRDVLTDPSWWHWATTIPMLILQLSGVHGAIEAAIAVCFCFTCAYFIRLRRWKPFPIQIRLAFLGLLLVGLLPGMIWVHWVQVIGTTAMVTVGYCLLARLLRLAPFNRTEPLTWSLIGQVLLRDPRRGGLLSLSQVPVPAGACCSMRNYAAIPMCTLPEVSSSELTSPLATRIDHTTGDVFSNCGTNG